MSDPLPDLEALQNSEEEPQNDHQANGDEATMADLATPPPEPPTVPTTTADVDSDSELEELDDEAFANFDVSALNIPDEPVQVDADNVASLGVHKRKRTAEEEEERRRNKKKKEGRREKTKRSSKKRATAAADRDGDEEFVGGEEVDGKRVRKSKVGPDGRPVKMVRRARTPENEDQLTPDERRRRALDRKMDEALKTHRPVRRRAGVDLEAMADAEIEGMRQRMAKACEADAEARARGEVATHKLDILPAVVELLNRNTIQAQLVDPDINILEAVRFMLEPADADAALPNYRIQRELFAVLAKLHIGKEALVASGIGKVVLFYTKSSQPQADIKRAAERLIGKWMGVVLKKSNAMRSSAANKPVETRAFDPLAASQAARSQQGLVDRSALAEERRRKALALPIAGNRARVEGGLGTYTIAPVNHLAGRMGPVGGSGEAFRRMIARSAGQGKK